MTPRAALGFRCLLNRFVTHRCGLCCRGLGFEQRAATCEPRCDVAAGQQSVMPDPDEPFRQDMHQKPANEFFGRERHLLGTVLIGVVLVAETDAIVCHRDQASVRNRHPMGITAEIPKDLLGSAEGRLGIDDPALPIQRSQELTESVVLLKNSIRRL